MLRHQLCLCASLFLSPAMVTQAGAAELTQQNLQKVATDLAHQYDANYAAKNADGMTHVYASNAILVSPSGKVVRGSAELKAYYIARFASGAKDHKTTINEVHLQGDGGYGVGTFAVTVKGTDGNEHRETGNIVTVYTHSADGWHLSLVIPSAPPHKPEPQ
jgi:ketosteroid isomerase-like protein